MSPGSVWRLILEPTYKNPSFYQAVVGDKTAWLASRSPLAFTDGSVWPAQCWAAEEDTGGKKRGRHESQRDGEYLLHAVGHVDKSGDEQRHRTDFPSVMRQHLIPHLWLQHIFKPTEQDCAYQTIHVFCVLLWTFKYTVLDTSWFILVNIYLKELLTWNRSRNFVFFVKSWWFCGSFL